MLFKKPVSRFHPFGTIEEAPTSYWALYEILSFTIAIVPEEFPVKISPILNNRGDDTFKEPANPFHDCTVPVVDLDETTSPFSKSLDTISTPNIGNHFSGIILPEEFASSKLPGMLPSKIESCKL